MNAKKRKKCHMICNAHIDPIWQWDWPEGVSAALSTFYSAACLCEEFDYIFCHNEALLYQFVEKYAPDLFVKIKELVRRGKWHIMGGWYLQPDCNMPSGESFVRQIREGQRYFEEKFGVKPTTAINLDPFGHTSGLVQIVKKCGQDSYLFMRPWTHELPLPSDQFIWRGPDGSELRATRVAWAYNSPLGKSASVIRYRSQTQYFPVGVVLWGVGNHGGGPSRKDLGDIERELLPDTETEFIHSTPEQFFSEIEPTDIVDRSLHISMPGCYTSMRRIKQLHARLECEISIAEKMATMAYMRGLLDEYPDKQILSAVEDLMCAQFHDVLPGTCIQSSEQSGLAFLNHGLLEVQRAKVMAYYALARTEQPAKEGEFPIVIFNPHPYELCENVECEFMLADQNHSTDIISHVTLKDKNGNTVPCQIVKEDSTINLDWRKRIIFPARLSPMTLTRYSAFVEFKAPEKKTASPTFTYDDGRKRVIIDEHTGLLRSYSVGGVELVSEGFGLCSFDDNADPWAMNADQRLRLGTGERAFSPCAHPSGVFEGMKTVQVIEDGEVYLGIEAFFECDSTRARISYKIYKNNDDVDIDVDLYMGDINKIVKLKLPIALSGELIGQTAFATQSLFTDARENVAHRFIAIDAGDISVALLNRDVYGSHYENGCLYMSLLRGASYCTHPIDGKPLMPPDRFTKKLDQGEHSFSFRLIATRRDQLERKCAEFVQSPYALNIFPIPIGSLAQKDFTVTLGDGTIAMPTVKKADGKEAVIFRLLNNTPNKKETYITVNGQQLPLSFGKYEVKTVVCENGHLTESYELLI